jgi:hypothetical protein
MPNNFSGILGKFILTTLLVISLLTFIIVLQKDNSAPKTMSDNPIFNNSFNSLSNQIENSSVQSQEQYGAFNSESPQLGFGSILIIGIVSIGKGFSGITFGFFSGLINLPLVVLGISSSIYNLLLTWLIVIMVIAVWLLYKLGGG